MMPTLGEVLRPLAPIFYITFATSSMMNCGHHQHRQVLRPSAPVFYITLLYQIAPPQNLVLFRICEYNYLQVLASTSIFEVLDLSSWIFEVLVVRSNKFRSTSTLNFSGEADLTPTW